MPLTYYKTISKESLSSNTLGPSATSDINKRMIRIGTSEKLSVSRFGGNAANATSITISHLEDSSSATILTILLTDQNKKKF